MSASFSLVAALGTPLNSDEHLEESALQAHLDDQCANGMTGVLVAGTMGLMQLLRDDTYRHLVDATCRHAKGRIEVMIGAGDTSFARTRDRVQFLNDKPIDAIVLLSPYLIRFSQTELLEYFSTLADFASRPVLLYDLPIMTGTKLELDTVLTLAKHPNITGIKCSGDFGWTRQLIDVAPPGFRVIVAQPDLVDMLFRHGIRGQLDGVFALAPAWASGIVDACRAGDWDLASTLQGQLSELLRVLKNYGVFPAFTALLNARGIPGNYAPRPFTPIAESQKAKLLSEPIVRRLLENHGGARM